MKHYNSFEDNSITYNGPCFIGQGASYSVGSDCYGYYVTSLKKSESGKLVAGLVEAKERYKTTWEDGTMDCSMPDDKTPTKWVTKFRGKWWFCNSAGERYLGSKCTFKWNGAYGYRDPSF